MALTSVWAVQKALPPIDADITETETRVGDFTVLWKLGEGEFGAVKACLGRWGALLARFVQSPTEQDTLLAALVRHCEADEAAREIFEHVANALFDCDDDILAEAAIERWAATAAEEDEGSLPRRLLKQADAFLTWLREADEEEDDEDDE